MSGRNRSQGWTHAKLSGHKNEELIAAKINADRSLREALARRLSIEDSNFEASSGARNEHSVRSVLGDKTKSKTDLILIWPASGRRVNVSIKKSAGGQAYLISVPRFISGFEQQFLKPIPNAVQRALALFFGSADDILEVISCESVIRCDLTPRHRAYQLRKSRLVWAALESYDNELAIALCSWFTENLPSITEFCFSKGLAADSVDWADVVWYRNEIGEGVGDTLFRLDELAKEMGSATGRALVKPGPAPGSTIWLPFGFVQWHLGCMQFHHAQASLMTSARCR